MTTHLTWKFHRGRFADICLENGGSHTEIKLNMELKSPQPFCKIASYLLLVSAGLSIQMEVFPKMAPQSLKFHSSNPPLLSSVLEGLKIHKLDFFSFAYERSCGTHSTGKVKEYFRTVGSSNLKHVLKFNEWHTHGRLICTKDTLALFGSYRNTPLPFYLERNTQ